MARIRKLVDMAYDNDPRYDHKPYDIDGIHLFQYRKIPKR